MFQYSNQRLIINCQVKKMVWAAKQMVPFLFGTATFPVFIFLHECGHYLTGICFGLRMKFHYAEVGFTGAKEKFTPQVDALVASAGPLVGAVFMLVGFLWLRRLRRHRIEAVPTARDWLATSLAMNVGRWLRGFTGSPSQPQPNDEAFVSHAIGLPKWFLPYLLGMFAVVALALIIRLHPPRERLFPFSWMLLGGVAGTLLWMRFVGPFLFP
ncbi:MAG: hypothetical protein JWQ71_3621 [Pedosphaera sp.]|nr:hypothetical protein [Pedosphaera sp.]